MKPFIAIALFSMVACGTSSERAVHKALQAGNADIHAERYEDAITAYSAAPKDPSALFGLGNANHRLAKWLESAAAYNDALQLQPDSVKGPTFYNLGTTQARYAFAADSISKKAAKDFTGIVIEGNDIAQKVEGIVMRDSLWKLSIQMSKVFDSTLVASKTSLRNALKIDPTDEDARYNLMVVQNTIDKLKKEEEERRKKNGDDKDKEETKLTAMALQLVQRADSLVEQYRFNEALDVLEGGLKRDPSLKKEEEYMKKLETVTDAAKAE
ncbi:MAG: tetratricopeptide repeat protein [Flavobacteriales bacterium]|nr:tetratricopeptide repeat protein [Flavobacteriales bacterium]